MKLHTIAHLFIAFNSVALTAASFGSSLSVRDEQALLAEGVCDSSSDCVLSALQVKRQKLSSLPHSVLTKRLRSDVGRDFPGFDGSQELTGSAWSDYSVSVTINGETFEVIVDTGSSIFAVAASAFMNCSAHYTGSCDGPSASASYGSGNWSGSICSGAEVSMAGLHAGAPIFAGITSVSHFLKRCNLTAEGLLGSVGIVGMAYNNPLLKGSFQGVPLFESVVSWTGIPNVFSIQCCGWDGKSAGGHGKLVLGGIDSALYTGELRYTPLTDELYYCVNMLRISAGSPAEPTLQASSEQSSCNAETGGTCFLHGCNLERGPTECRSGLCRCKPGSCAMQGRCVEENGSVEADLDAMMSPSASADFLPPGQESSYARTDWFRKSPNPLAFCNTIVDSGVTMLTLSKESYVIVMSAIQEVAITHRIHCVTNLDIPLFPDIVIELEGGVSLAVPAMTYFQQPGGGQPCLLLSIGTTGKSSYEAPNILGQVVMENYYTVFDRENARVGFASIAGCLWAGQ